jgi:predicted ArsR family transcriptional regulator
MTQLSLEFDSRRLARKSDPATSHAAAEDTKAFRARHVATIWNALKERGPMTKDEIAAVTGLDHVAVARRMVELEAKKLAERTSETRPSATGRAATVWRGL